MPELQLWAQHQQERLQQGVDESGPSIPVTSGFFTQIARAESFPELQPFLLINPVGSRTLFASGTRTQLYSHQNSKEVMTSLSSPSSGARSLRLELTQITHIGLHCISTCLEVEVPPFSEHFHNLNSLFPLESAETDLDQPEGHSANSDGEENIYL